MQIYRFIHWRHACLVLGLTTIWLDPVSAQPPLPKLPELPAIRLPELPGFPKVADDESTSADPKGTDDSPSSPLLTLQRALESAEGSKDQLLEDLQGVVLRGKSQMESMLAARGLADHSDGIPGKVIEKLKSAASGSDEILASLACITLSKAGESGIAALRDIVEDPSASSRAIAVQALARADALDRETAWKLVDDSDPLIRDSALDGIASLGSVTKAESDRLLGIITSGVDESVRMRAAFALGRTITDASTLVDVLGSDSENTPSLSVQRALIRGLSNNDRPSGTAAVLAAGLAVCADELRSDLVDGLVGFGEASVPDLLNALDDAESRLWATIALGEIGPPSESSVAKLVRLLPDAQEEVQSEILMALGKIGVSNPDVAQAVSESLQSTQRSIHYAAMFAVLTLGLDGSELQASLQEYADGTDVGMKLLSRVALAKLNPDNLQAGLGVLRDIREVLDQPDHPLQPLAQALRFQWK
ncbi:MAG: HEAT repeat domain-containing protein [Planctomycetota bacterium]